MGAGRRAVDIEHAWLILALVNLGQAERDLEGLSNSELRTLLLSPQGKLIASWEDTPSVGEIGIIVRRALGKPNYAQMSSAPR